MCTTGKISRREYENVVPYTYLNDNVKEDEQNSLNNLIGTNTTCCIKIK